MIIIFTSFHIDGLFKLKTGFQAAAQILDAAKADKAVAVIEGVSAHHPGFLFMEFSKPQIGHAIKSNGRLGKGGGGKCGQGGERGKGDQGFLFDFPFG